MHLLNQTQKSKPAKLNLSPKMSPKSLDSTQIKLNVQIKGQNKVYQKSSLTFDVQNNVMGVKNGCTFKCLLYDDRENGMYGNDGVFIYLIKIKY